MAIHAVVPEMSAHWIPIPTQWTDEWRYPVWWADDVARSRWTESGLPHEKIDVDRTSALLARCALNWGPESVQSEHHLDPAMEIRTYLYLPEPSDIPMPVRTMVIAADVVRREKITLEDIVQVNDPQAVTDVEVDKFENPHLGVGLRTFRHRDDYSETGPSVGEHIVLKYGFAVPGADDLLYVVLSWPDLKAVHRSRDAVDAFVRNIQVEHRADPIGTERGATALGRPLEDIEGAPTPTPGTAIDVHVSPEIQDPIWFPVPSDWHQSAWADSRRWASQWAPLLWTMTALIHDAKDVQFLTSQLERFADVFGPDCHHPEHSFEGPVRIQTLLHLRDPEQSFLAVRILVLENPPLDDEALLGASDPEIVQPAEVAQFPTDHLGTATRSMRWVRLDSQGREAERTFSAYRYLLRVPGHNHVVLVSASHSSVVRLEDARDDITSLVKGLTWEAVPRPNPSPAGAPREVIDIRFENADSARWVDLPDRWTAELPDAESWAREVAESAWIRSGVTAEEQANDELVQNLTALGERFGADGEFGSRSGHLTWTLRALVHLPDPRVPPALVAADVVIPEDDEDTLGVLHSFLQRNSDPESTRIEVEPFTVQTLGSGFVGRAITPGELEPVPRNPVSTLTYVLPLPERREVLVVTVSEPGIYRVDALRPDLEELLAKLVWEVRSVAPATPPAPQATPTLHGADGLAAALKAGEHAAVARQDSIPGIDDAKISWFKAWGRRRERRQLERHQQGR